MLDQFTFENAAKGGLSLSATATFDCLWHGGGEQVEYGSAADGFHFRGVTGPATIEWSAENDEGFSFTSDPSGSTTVFAAAGFERNGVFLEEDEEDDDD